MLNNESNWLPSILIWKVFSHLSCLKRLEFLKAIKNLRIFFHFNKLTISLMDTPHTTLTTLKLFLLNLASVAPLSRVISYFLSNFVVDLYNIHSSGISFSFLFPARSKYIQMNHLLASWKTVGFRLLAW